MNSNTILRPPHSNHHSCCQDCLCSQVRCLQANSDALRVRKIITEVKLGNPSCHHGQVLVSAESPHGDSNPHDVMIQDIRLLAHQGDMVNTNPSIFSSFFRTWTLRHAPNSSHAFGENHDLLYEEILDNTRRDQAFPIDVLHTIQDSWTTPNQSGYTHDIPLIPGPCRARFGDEFSSRLACCPGQSWIPQTGSPEPRQGVSFDQPISRSVGQDLSPSDGLSASQDTYGGQQPFHRGNRRVLTRTRNSVLAQKRSSVQVRAIKASENVALWAMCSLFALAVLTTLMAWFLNRLH